MYLIRNKDGSIKKAYTSEFVNQGSNDVNYVDMALLGRDISEWTCDCFFELPNGEVVQLAGTEKEFVVDNVTYKGYRVYLSSAVLVYPGLLKIVARNYDANGSILYSYPFSVMVNATTLDSTYDAPITIAQYNSFMKLLATYITKYDTHLIRKYDTIENANKDISNITESEHVFISNGDGDWSFYYKAKATDTELTFVSSQGGGGTSAPVTAVLFVDTLPEKGQPRILYLTPSTTENKYAEYLWLEDAWCNAGSVLIDFVDLATNQKIGGIKTFTSEIKTNQVANTNGNALIRFKEVENKNVFGGSTIQTTLMGSTERPYYSNNGADFTGKELALMNDVITKQDKIIYDIDDTNLEITLTIAG